MILMHVGAHLSDLDDRGGAHTPGSTGTKAGAGEGAADGVAVNEIPGSGKDRGEAYQDIGTKPRRQRKMIIRT